MNLAQAAHLIFDLNFFLATITNTWYNYLHRTLVLREGFFIFKDENAAASVAEVKGNMDDFHAGLLHMAINQSIEAYVREHGIEINKTARDYLQDPQFIRLFYSQNVMKKAIKDHIHLTLQKETYGQGVERRYPGLLEYVGTIADERARALLLGRLSGKSYRELGQKHHLTHEWVRQIVLKQLKNRPRLAEDRYIEVFRKYGFEKEDFMAIFNESELTYHYLCLEYSEGVSFRKAAEKIAFKKYLTIDGQRVKITKSDLSHYVLKTFFKHEASYEVFVAFYTGFLQEHNLASNEKLLFDIERRSYHYKFAEADYVLWKQNKRLRYYDMASYDFEELLKTLAFDRYSDIEYSTLKFFRDYPELMRKYDIQDEYELHNLLKKLYKGKGNSNINFRRMPNIQFGRAHRDKQILELFHKYAPVSLNALAELYEREYGVRAVP